MFTKKLYPEILLNIVSVHGVYSKGGDLATLCEQVSGDVGLSADRVKVSTIDYGVLLLMLLVVKQENNYQILI